MGSFLEPSQEQDRLGLTLFDHFYLEGRVNRGSVSQALARVGKRRSGTYTPSMPLTTVSPAGFFFQPTVFTDVEDHMYIAKEESFGPIMIVSRFADGYVIRCASLGFFSVCMES